MNHKVYSATSYDGGWYEVATNTSTEWETVDPKNRTINHHYDHLCRDLIK